MEDYESIICVKPEVQVYKIGPRPSNRGFRAADWKLEEPDWKGRLRIVSKNNRVLIKLEDKTTGELFAQSPVEGYPGLAVEAVLDSSRYFVLRIEDDSGRHAFIGMGFQDRGDAFDFNVSLQDHFNYIKKEKQLQEEAAHPEQVPKLDLSLKEGQTIRINIGSKDENAVSRPKPRGGQIGVLPPPPGGANPPKLAPPPGATGSRSPVMSHPTPMGVPQQAAPQPSLDLLGGFAAPPPPQQMQAPADWGDFASAGSGSSSGGGWVTF